jgi:hypothetical protein
MGERGYMLVFVLVGAFLEGAIFTEACSFFVEKVKNQLSGLLKYPCSHIFSMPSLTVEVEGYFGKYITLIFLHAFDCFPERVLRVYWPINSVNSIKPKP